MKEDIELLSASLARILTTVEVVKVVAAHHEYYEIGSKARALAESLKANALELSELIALRVAEGGDYE